VVSNEIKNPLTISPNKKWHDPIFFLFDMNTIVILISGILYLVYLAT
jgi:hypothetical protein